MEQLKKLAFKAFEEGDDNFGEKPTGEIIEFSFSKQLKQYFIVLEIDDEGSTINTDVGIKETKKKLAFYSGGFVFKVDKTEELLKELKEANISEY